MFSRDDTRRARRGKFAGIAFLALLAPISASSVIAPTGNIDVPAQADAPAAPEKEGYPSGTYQLRCWQYGRLLFEENYISLPADASRYSIKLAGKDRNGKPIYVADTKTATCLIRTPIEERGYPRQTP